LIKTSQPFGKKFQKTVGGDFFFDLHCTYIYILHTEEHRGLDIGKTKQNECIICFYWSLNQSKQLSVSTQDLAASPMYSTISISLAADVEKHIQQ